MTAIRCRLSFALVLATALASAVSIPCAHAVSPPDSLAARPGLLKAVTRTVHADLDHLVSRRTAWILGGGAALSAASLSFENPQREAVGLERAAFADGVSDFGNAWGGPGALGAALALTAAGHLAGSPRVTGAGLDMSRALIYSGVLVSALKVTVNRTRPNGAPYSFPSGHSAAAFSVAPVIGQRFGRVAGVLAYGLATATGMGRIEDRKHYLSDVAFGAAIGTACGLAVTHANT
jgi:membrane-associated phospholipid phosphatase